MGNSCRVESEPPRTCVAETAAWILLLLILPAAEARKKGQGTFTTLQKKRCKKFIKCENNFSVVMKWYTSDFWPNFLQTTWWHVLGSNTQRVVVRKACHKH